MNTDPPGNDLESFCEALEQRFSALKTQLDACLSQSSQNAELLTEQAAARKKLTSEVEQMRAENSQLKSKIEALRKHLELLSTILEKSSQGSDRASPSRG